jgi:hypothetical protein
MTLPALALSLLLPAQAGKLADGFRGLPFGDASVAATQPLDDCLAGDVEGVLWLCTSTIGSSPVVVAYMGGDGLFTGVYITAQGYEHRAPLLAAMQGAWGAGIEGGARIDRIWRDGTVIGSFKHNRYSGETAVAIYDTAVSKEQKARAAARARKAAAGDL